jgi:two-component system, sensor histidine kinase and response regulator
MQDRKTTLLVVDDDPFVLDMVREMLQDHGYDVVGAGSGEEAAALHKAAEIPIDLILSDMNMPGMDGLALIRTVRETDPHLPIMILTVNDEISVALKAIRSGADEYVLKDENIHETLLPSIEGTLEKHRLQVENRRLLADLSRKNAELERSNAELKEINHLKNRFLGIAAHDLRTPIGGVISISDILLSQLGGQVTHRQHQLLGMIHSVSREMLGLIDDLLDVSIIESGKLELALAPADIRPIIAERIRLGEMAAGRKNIRIHADLGATPAIPADTRRIAQAFDNFLSNAVKFSPQGSDIHVYLKNQGETVEVSVKDEGPGVSAQDRERLFGEFQKLSAQPTGGEMSVGLGLAIVKKVIEAHGGAVWVDSAPGQGAVFGFRLPVAGAADVG